MLLAMQIWLMQAHQNRRLKGDGRRAIRWVRIDELDVPMHGLADIGNHWRCSRGVYSLRAPYRELYVYIGKKLLRTCEVMGSATVTLASTLYKYQWQLHRSV